MPKRKRSFAARRKFRKRKRPRRIFKTRRRYRSRVSRLRLGGFPSKKLVKLRYAEVISLDASAGGIAVHRFSAGGMFDPNLELGGHQSSNFDRWTAVYQNHVVIGSKISAVFHTVSNTNVNLGYVGIKLVQNPLIDSPATIYNQTYGLPPTPIGIAGLLEQPSNNTLKVFAGNAAQSANRAKMVTNRYSWKKMYPGAKLQDDRFIGTATSNPADVPQFHVYQCGINTGASDPGPIQVTVTIDYLAVFFEKLPDILS